MTGTMQDLDRLLSRLDHALLSDDADAQLRHSEYHRRKIGAVGISSYQSDHLFFAWY